jgi:hypothetical protein
MDRCRNVVQEKEQRNMTSLSEDTANPSEVLAKATLRAAVAMKIGEEQLATVLGVDTDFVGVVIEPTSSPGLRAQQLIRIYQQLLAITGNDTVAMAHWMTTRNRQFDCSPRDRMMTAEGLDDVTYYLESIL